MLDGGGLSVQFYSLDSLVTAQKASMNGSFRVLCVTSEGRVCETSSRRGGDAARTQRIARPQEFTAAAQESPTEPQLLPA